MKFGKVDDPSNVNFTIPDDHPGMDALLSNLNRNGVPDVFVGCAKWNRKELKNFYPRGTKDELEYYAKQFNCVEMNATFYRNFSEDQVSDWYEKVPASFRFFPKVFRMVSHLKWLNNIEGPVDEFLGSVVHFREKLGTVFLQMRDNFAPKFFDRLVRFVEEWPDDIPLAVELRHPDWFSDSDIAEEFHHLLEENNVANVLVDTAGRRDMMHMRLTNNEAFIRFVGANHPSDYDRIDEWVLRLKKWSDEGLQNIHFFVHQNVEKASPVLAAHFIRNLNRELGTSLNVPDLPDNGDDQGTLF
jgi:uncharacterized protein YecE (DUF72 family)